MLVQPLFFLVDDWYIVEHRSLFCLFIFLVAYSSRITTSYAKNRKKRLHLTTTTTSKRKQQRYQWGIDSKQQDAKYPAEDETSAVCQDWMNNISKQIHENGFNRRNKDKWVTVNTNIKAAGAQVNKTELSVFENDQPMTSKNSNSDIDTNNFKTCVCIYIYMSMFL